MSREDLVSMDGRVTEVAGLHYHVLLDIGCTVVAILSAPMERLSTLVQAGDRVSVGVSSSDLTQGTITFRHQPGR